MFSLYSKSQEERALLPPQCYSLLAQGTVVVVASQVPARTFLHFPLPHAKNKVRGFYVIAEEWHSQTRILFCFVMFQEYKMTKLSRLLDVELLSLLEDHGIQVREPRGSLGYLCHGCLFGCAEFCLEFSSIFRHTRKYSLCT